MNWNRGKTRAVLMAVALCGAAAEARHLVRNQPDTLVGCAPIARPFADRYSTRVSLTIKDFHPQGNQFSGALVASVGLQEALIFIGPSHQYLGYDGARYQPVEPKKLKADFEEMRSSFQGTMLQFRHYTDDHGFEQEGGSVGSFVMNKPKLAISLEGSGTFNWTATAVRRSFYYPFDQYVLAVNPELLTEFSEDEFIDHPVDQLSIDFSGTGFVPRLESLGEVKGERDRQRILVQRPMLLRVISGVVGVLLMTWLLYLIISPKAGEQAGQLVTLFVGVFSVRNSLLSGAPTFPSLIDYCALGVYLSAVLIVLIRWLIPDPPGRTCPFCCSAIPEKAAVCPACTQALETLRLA